MMSLKEIIALALGFIILLVGSFVGRDFSDPAAVRDGFLMIVLFVGFFIVVTYLNTSIEEEELETKLGIKEAPRAYLYKHTYLACISREEARLASQPLQRVAVGFLPMGRIR